MTPMDSSLLIIKNTDAVVTFHKSNLTVLPVVGSCACVSVYCHVVCVRAERCKLHRK